MSKGEIDPSRKPWAKTKIGPHKLLGKVSSQALAVEMAEGDVGGANENMREEVALAQKRIDAAEERLEDRQREVLEGLRDMDLLGRRMEIRSGTAIAVITEDGDDFKSEPSAQDLSGAKGVLAGFEVGSLLDVPLESASTIVLMVATDEDSPVPQGVYALTAEADYMMDEVPQPDEQPA